VMAAAGLSVLNVFVLGLVQRKRERAMLRAIGVVPRQEQAVIIAHAVVLCALVAVLGGLGGLVHLYLWSLGSPVYYGVKLDWGLLGLPLRTGVAAVTVLVFAASVYPVIHARRLETAEVLRSS
jgi:putative ABC transport system permease protein